MIDIHSHIIPNVDDGARSVEETFNILKEAIYEAYSRCESMRLRLITDSEGNVMQYVADREERDIEFFDFSNWRMEDAEAKMREWTETPFEREDSPLNRVVMIVTPDNYKGIYLLVDHMTMDAQSIIVFFRDIIEIYCNKRYEGVEYPKEMYSYIKQLEKDLEYEANSKAKERDIIVIFNLNTTFKAFCYFFSFIFESL